MTLTNQGNQNAGERTDALVAVEERVRERTAHVGVIGMGYVGLPTMVSAAKAGFSVTGLDTNEGRVASINAGESYIEDVASELLAELVMAGKITATTDYSCMSGLDVVLVCVPTPITKNKEPDLRPMESAVQGLAAHMKAGQLIVLQSTTFPGTTQEFVLPRLEESKLEVGKDFCLAFALERIDPGNSQFDTRSVPKVVGGITSRCTGIAESFFSAFVDQVFPVSSPRVAEMTKLLENTFRSVNIALVNELAMLCQRMDINIWEVLDAASTKPFGFMPFYPGPGVGGHCIPVDPFYLSWKAKEHDFYVNFIQLAAEVNDNMPYYTLSRIGEILAEQGQALKDAKLLILGATFKKNIKDARNSPAVRVMELLVQRGALVSYSDENLASLNVGGSDLESVAIQPQMLAGFDAVVLLVDHDYYDLESIASSAKLLIDVTGRTRKLEPRSNIVLL